MIASMTVKVAAGRRWWVDPAIFVAWYVFWATPALWRDRLYERFSDFVAKHGVWTSVDGA